MQTKNQFQTKSMVVTALNNKYSSSNQPNSFDENKQKIGFLNQ